MSKQDKNGVALSEKYSKSIEDNHFENNDSHKFHPKREDYLTGFKIWYAISFALQLGFLIIVPIGGFMLLGLWVDKYLNTAPFLLIAGVIVGVIITGYEVYHLLMVLIKK